ncbi:hypothetical protein BGZ47_001732, partial [Haplosporangium gracile]
MAHRPFIFLFLLYRFVAASPSVNSPIGVLQDLVLVVSTLLTAPQVLGALLLSLADSIHLVDSRRRKMVEETPDSTEEATDSAEEKEGSPNNVEKTEEEMRFNIIHRPPTTLQIESEVDDDDEAVPVPENVLSAPWR